MKHDEKKIEEVLECVYNTEDDNYTQYTQLEVENAMKQYVEHMVQQERERMWQDYKTQETIHNMMLDSLSIMSIEKFVVWRDKRKAINQD